MNATHRLWCVVLATSVLLVAGCSGLKIRGHDWVCIGFGVHVDHTAVADKQEQIDAQESGKAAEKAGQGEGVHR